MANGSLSTHMDLTLRAWINILRNNALTLHYGGAPVLVSPLHMKTRCCRLLIIGPLHVSSHISKTFFSSSFLMWFFLRFFFWQSYCCVSLKFQGLQAGNGLFVSFQISQSFCACCMCGCLTSQRKNTLILHRGSQRQLQTTWEGRN